VANPVNQREVGPIGIAVMAILGLILLPVAAYWKQQPAPPSQEAPLWATVLAFAAMFLSLAVYFWIANRRTAASWGPAPADWAQVPAHSVDFVHARDGYVLPGYLVARFRDAHGNEREVVSNELGFDPRPFLPTPVMVRYDPKADPASAAKRAKIDASFLPQVVFHSLPSACESVPEIREAVIRDGIPAEPTLAGFRLNVTDDDTEVETRIAVLQRFDPVAKKLHVMEGFPVTNATGSFPAWQPGKLFRAWIHRDEPGMYVIAKESL
jgi:hypothetical protein